MKASYTLAELSGLLDATLQGDGDIVITGLATLERAGPGKLSFLSNPRYKFQLASCQASAVIIHPDLAAETGIACLLSKSPYVTYAKVSQLFAAHNPYAVSAGMQIHASAVVSPDAKVADDVVLGPHVVVEAGAVIAAGCRIGAGCYIGENVSLGEHGVLYPNVTLYHDVCIGERVVLHSGVVIGADGFGFAFDGEKSVKIAQLGAVRIGADVEIGAGSTVDRGALDDTVIEEGVKIDNQVQIGHNCVVGAHTIICGCTALAGSSRIGRYCVLGGGVGVVGHLSIVDRVTVSAMTMVNQSIDKPGLYSSGTLMQESALWKRNVLTLGKLADLSKTVKNLEKQLRKSSEQESGKES